MRYSIEVPLVRSTRRARSDGRRSLLRGALALGIVFLVAVPSNADPIKDALDRGATFLASQQNPDGGYGPYSPRSRVPNASDVGITSFVLYAFASHPRGYTPEDGPFISRAIDYLLSKQQPDGGFYDPRDPVLQNYRTCVALMALSRLDRVRYRDAIAKARRFVKSLQLDESRSYSGDRHLSYGAVGYGGGLRGDLSNTAYAAEALYVSGEATASPFWKRLESYVANCQNSTKVSPLLERAGIGTTGDWGFRYAPNDTRGPIESVDGDRVFSSYGTMTYQGLKTLLYAQVSRSDERVRKAFEWISRNFTVTENPGIATKDDPAAGKQGLFYYYHTMAKALAAYGEPVVVDAKGTKHRWADVLSRHLVRIQHAEGYWVNTSDRWWENLKELDTSFAMVALATCREELRREAARAEAEANDRAEGGQ